MLCQLVFHPEHRITVDEALEHAYLADLHGQVKSLVHHILPLSRKSVSLFVSIFAKFEIIKNMSISFETPNFTLRTHLKFASFFFRSGKFLRNMKIDQNGQK